MNFTVAREVHQTKPSVTFGVRLLPWYSQACSCSECFALDWADAKLPRLKDSVVHASSSSAAQSSTPRPSSSRAPLAATPPTRPLQKHISPSNDPGTPQSRKRLEDIAAGLREREQDLSPIRLPSPLKEREPSILSSNVHAIPQPPSPVPTEVDCEDKTQPRKTFSFLGLDRSPEPVTATIPQEGQPSTPKKRRLIPPAEATAISPTADATPFDGGLPLTPPQTTRRVAQRDRPMAVSARIPSRKGKEREDFPPARTEDQVGAYPFRLPNNVVLHGLPLEI